MGKPHKHAELIKAWADGYDIEYFEFDAWWYTTFPTWDLDKKYRIKPEPKPDVVRYGWAQYNERVGIDVAPDDAWYQEHESHRNLKLTFDGETGKLKSAEVL